MLSASVTPENELLIGYIDLKLEEGHMPTDIFGTQKPTKGIISWQQP